MRTLKFQKMTGWYRKCIILRLLGRVGFSDWILQMLTMMPLDDIQRLTAVIIV